MNKLHTLTITIVTETVQTLMDKAAVHILDHYTCHNISDAVRIRLQHEHHWTYQDAREQACAVSQVLRELGHTFCDERDVEHHYSFIINHVEQVKREWEPEFRQNVVFFRTAVHAMRLDWLVFLQQDLRG